jgi:hypothetical protein
MIKQFAGEHSETLTGTYFKIWWYSHRQAEEKDDHGSP